ncbi:MAG: bifunctional methylenetetrahydrofolate dehydrogenase/methenyltetrahydrofolate cyclohydrolase FolD [Planctomycetes bacterium]|nr:bifunctional methylenetetrahydrofolate dehydrogenase/methenyltetrahydrofolate cyclohydrolase FolD [Planctomycetota bacterium]
MATIIDGKKIALEAREKIRLEIDELKNAGKRLPGLVVIIVGEDPASKVYVRNKKMACEKAGFVHRQINLPAESTEEQLLTEIQALNKDSEIDGILVQLPLPKHINEDNIISSIDPEKDVDGFHPVNVGKLVLGQEAFVPCTPLGVMKMLAISDIDLSGKEVVVIGRSNIVGKPMSLLALQKAQGANATVTICHSRTQNIEEVIARADVVVAAIGIPKFVKAHMVKEGAVVIDVGVNRLEDGSLCGDVDFDAIQSKASAITPVPGGVGPMTIAMLLNNTLQSRMNKERT